MNSIIDIKKIKNFDKYPTKNQIKQVIKNFSKYLKKVRKSNPEK